MNNDITPSQEAEINPDAQQRIRDFIDDARRQTLNAGHRRGISGKGPATTGFLIPLPAVAVLQAATYRV